MKFRKKKEHKSEDVRRIVAILMALFVFMTLMLSTFFIVHKADHKCSGKDCPVCALIQMSESNLRQLGGGAPAASAMVTLVIFFMMMQKCSDNCIIFSTPVSQKTRLNN